MGRSTLNPARELVSQKSLQSGAKRQLERVTLNTSNTGAFSRMLMRGPDSKAQVTYVGVNNPTQIYHAAGAVDAWIFDLINSTTGATLNSVAASLSGQTLAATAFKSIPVDNGNSTLKSGDGLQLQLTVSGVPQTLFNAQVQVEWVPLTDT